ncbi:hypothetical protein Bsp3421_006351 [Burkholderia sp. FERM BP-3421]|uniref:hypothetical protein n=1 Tax=Burkholderia sp. FERM BP-3421 TaxID=1494466 RepID=UPI002360B0A6|nr:hypothetical protein [Burkholderia sp. FERM BP-3421]WDD96153.1 hypothetical protein Bsp3421_006351 [Burkholderia sp. FERM BP-3421]
MQAPLHRHHLLALALLAATLSACGGGDDGGTSSTGSTASPLPASPAPEAPAPSAQAACRPSGRFTYSGSASQVAASNGQLAVVVVPSLPTAYQKKRNFTAPAAPASSLVQQPSGGFTTLAASAAATDCLGLDHGMVTDIQSVGADVAIGRWTQAMDTDRNTYNGEQGVSYAVGTPLTLSATSGSLVCTSLIAGPVANNTGAEGGSLGTASATLDLAARTLNNLSLSITVINTPYTVTKAQTPLNGVSSEGMLTVQSVVVGHDAKRPLVALGYSAAPPNTQGVGGVVVMSCQ